MTYRSDRQTLKDPGKRPGSVYANKRLGLTPSLLLLGR